MRCLRMLAVLTILIIFSLSIVNCLNLPKCCPYNHELRDGKCIFDKAHYTEGISPRKHGSFNFTERVPECPHKLVLVESKFNTGGLEGNKSFTKNGYFRHGDIYYPSNEYCVNRIEFDADPGAIVSISAWICDPECSDANTCFPKCCPPDEVLQSEGVEEVKVNCSSSGTKYWLPLVDNEDNSSPNGTVLQNPRFIVTGSIMSGLEESFYFSKNDIPGFNHIMLIRILKNGSALAGPRLIRFDTDFCLDGVLSHRETNGANQDALEFSGDSEDVVLLQKRNKPGKLETKTKNTMTANFIYKGAFFIAAIFLLLNITVYISLWETRKSVYWLTQLSYFVSLFFMYIFLAGAFILPLFVRIQRDKSTGGPLCCTVGILAHFFFLSTFCWMTMINVDIWSTFGFPDRMISKSRSMKSNHKRFRKYIWYALFAIGAPLLIVGIAVVLDNHPDARELDLITPDYGRENCYIKGAALFPYLYGPIGVLLTVNAIIYVTTVVSVIRFKHKDKKMTIALNKSSKGTPNPVSESKQSLKLFAKLLLIMGVPWVFELIGWANGNDIWVWQAFDIINILQSVLIFFIFICKNAIFRELRGKYGCLDKLLTFLHINLGALETPGTSTGTATTSTSGSDGRKKSTDVNVLNRTGNEHQ